MGNPVRFCPVCEKADDHPRHDPGFGDPRVVPHMDCCRERGCPDGSCPIVTEGAEDLRGDKLRAHLTNPKTVKAVRKKLDERDEATRNYEATDGSGPMVTLDLSQGGNA